MQNKAVEVNSMRDVLQKTILFRGLSEEELDMVLAALPAHVRSLKQEEAYSMPGDVLDHVGIIIRGEMRISKIEDTGDEHLIQKLHSGYMVGADIVYTTTRINPFYMYASADTMIWQFPGQCLMNRSTFDPSVNAKLQMNMIGFLANENVRKQFKIDVLSQNGLRDRILSYLTTRSQKLGTREFYIPFDREEMANYLCVNRSALSHELSVMKKEGIIDFRKNFFCLKSVDKEV